MCSLDGLPKCVRLFLGLLPIVGAFAVIWFVVVVHDNVEENDENKGILQLQAPFESKVRHHGYEAFNIHNGSLWEKAFFFVQIFNPNYEALRYYGSDHSHLNISRSHEKGEQHVIWKTIQAVNRLNPKPLFVAMKAPYQRSTWNDSLYSDIASGFKRLVAELDPEIELVLIIESHQPNETVSKAALLSYKSHYGEDHYELWSNGVKFIITNSNLDYGDNEGVHDMVIEYQEWLKSSFKEAKKGNYTHVIVIQHSLFAFNETDNREVTASSGSRLKAMSEAGVDYLLTFEGHKELANTSNVQMSRKSSEEHDSKKSPSHGHKHILNVQEKNPVHDNHHNHEDHEGQVHSHYHAKYETPLHEHFPLHTGLSSKYGQINIIVSTQLDEDDYRVVWIFRDSISQEVFETNLA